jgi:transposase
LDFRARPNGWVKTDPIDVRQGYAPPLTQPVPGWYLDPSGRHRSRFWDGERWRDGVDGSARFKRSFERHTGRMLRGLRPADRVDVERRRIALDLLADVRRIDDPLEALGKRIGIAVVASGTAVTDVYGIGPWAAAVIVGHTGDVHRFPSTGHYARCNATAPLEASSGPRVRHRLNPRGNRQLNHALHVAAISQISPGTPGRTYFLLQDRGRQRPAKEGCAR